MIQGKCPEWISTADNERVVVVSIITSHFSVLDKYSEREENNNIIAE